jgi:hypothetical protein
MASPKQSSAFSFYLRADGAIPQQLPTAPPTNEVQIIFEDDDDDLPAEVTSGRVMSSPPAPLSQRPPLLPASQRKAPPRPSLSPPLITPSPSSSPNIVKQLSRPSSRLTPVSAAPAQRHMMRTPVSRPSSGPGPASSHKKSRLSLTAKELEHDPGSPLPEDSSSAGTTSSQPHSYEDEGSDSTLRCKTCSSTFATKSGQRRHVCRFKRAAPIARPKARIERPVAMNNGVPSPSPSPRSVLKLITPPTDKTPGRSRIAQPNISIGSIWTATNPVHGEVALTYAFLLCTTV